MRYTHEQGLVKRRLKFEELFHPSTLELKEDTAFGGKMSGLIDLSACVNSY